jgi:hypothetical protein
LGGVKQAMKAWDSWPMCIFMEEVVGGSYSCLHFNFGNHSLLMKTNETNLIMLIIVLNTKEPMWDSQSGDHLKIDFAKLAIS